MKKLLKYSLFFVLAAGFTLFADEPNETNQLPEIGEEELVKAEEARKQLLPDTENLQYIECKLAPINPSEERYLYHYYKSQKMINLPAPQTAIDKIRAQLPSNGVATSTNWAGYVSATNMQNPTPGSVQNVGGIWLVPGVNPSYINTFLAIWVGIDGYSNGTVEQIGTAHEWVNGQFFSYAWFEMYPNDAFLIENFPVLPNDLIGAISQYIGNGIFQLSIYNYTRGIYSIVPISATIAPNAQRSSAEWIVEAPFLNGVLPLAQFAPIPMANCKTTINGIFGPINSPFWQNNVIYMIGNGYYKAIPSGLSPDGSGFITFWQGY